MDLFINNDKRKLKQPSAKNGSPVFHAIMNFLEMFVTSEYLIAFVAYLTITNEQS
jgi:hypothetical protein